ncbi:MAG: hypothetical protein JOZ69_02445, partial [Myxococcales bacterium]|nr:hypothetical protein [Myxococcales bacterium]
AGGSFGVVGAGTHTVVATDTISVTTLSGGVTVPFADSTIVYTTDGVTVPNCQGIGTSVTGSTATIPIGATPGTTIALNAVACGAGQTASASTASALGGNVTFRVGVATPAIANNIGQSSGAAPTFTITAQNPVTATVSDATAGAYLCTTLNGTNPACAATVAASMTTPCTTGTKLTGTTVAPTSGQTLKAIACATDIDTMTIDHSAVSSSYAYTFAPTPAVLGAVANTCPATVPIGIDTTALAADQARGGPTTGETVCYSFTTQPLNCTGGTGISCFNPTVASPTQSISLTNNANKTLFWIACSPSAAIPNVSSNQTVRVPAGSRYTPPTIVVNGDVSEWTTKELSAASATGVQGGFTYNVAGSHVFVEASGFTSTATAELVVYLADNQSAAGTTTTTPESATATLPFAAEFAIVVPLSAACNDGTGVPAVCAPSVSQNNGTAWSNAGAGAPVPSAAVAVAGTPGAEIDIPTAGTSLAGATLVSVAAEIIDTTTTPATISSQWPSVSGAWHFVRDDLTSCVTPSASIQ